ncbi:polysaccharide deacetylase family protein [Colwellia piezophila]|uniref:polysaccharide deacetylase family protein n=1 Tax=Colwellia piezophila TaxID=211668 RepID=UPI0003701375|nr:polysaccharide deacetylase family protein [Colwellia piezophila]
MLKAIKIIALFIIKYLGGFWLARKLNKGNTCVLCYHGFAYDDEYLFRPKLFMRPESFKKRLAWLQDSPYKIVSLSEAVNNQHNGNLVVLTMDDGWAGTKELVGDTLAEHNFPLMLYVTSYYVQKQGAVINVALAYILWKSAGKTLVIDEPILSITKEYVISAENTVSIVTELCQLIDGVASFSVRQRVLLDIAKQLQVNLHSNGQLMFRSLNTEELTALQQSNVDIQLHTHRHCSPQNEQEFKLEVSQNIDYLQQLELINTLQHFCYPSGEYYLPQLPWLKECGVVTATTVSSGMLTSDTDRLQIPRFLDGADVHQIEFEAELCGLSSAIRKLASFK